MRCNHAEKQNNIHRRLCSKRSGPSVTKISNPSTHSSTQILKRNVHTFEVKTQSLG